MTGEVNKQLLTLDEEIYGMYKAVCMSLSQ